jgi:hypothetical protein
MLFEGVNVVPEPTKFVRAASVYQLMFPVIGGVEINWFIEEPAQ